MRIINAPLKIDFGKVSKEFEAQCRAEFDRLSENNDDPISAWIRNIRSRGRVVDENEPILQLLIELHRKIDALSAQINNESKNYLALESSAVLEAIGHNVLIFGANSLMYLPNGGLEVGAKYYGRLDIAVFPPRKIPLFFIAQDSKNAEICLMHGRDEVDFDNYIAARERSIIRESRAEKR